MYRIFKTIFFNQICIIELLTILKSYKFIVYSAKIISQSPNWAVLGSLKYISPFNNYFIFLSFSNSYLLGISFLPNLASLLTQDLIPLSLYNFLFWQNLRLGFPILQQSHLPKYIWLYRKYVLVKILHSFLFIFFYFIPKFLKFWTIFSSIFLLFYQKSLSTLKYRRTFKIISVN